jgi:hypothetical protein
MAYQEVFERRFEVAVEKALSSGVRGAFVEGCTYGVASGLIYVAEALLFYVGAVLIARGTYTYLQMVEVLTLVVFTVSIGSQLMAFSTFSPPPHTHRVFFRNPLTVLFQPNVSQSPLKQRAISTDC